MTFLGVLHLGASLLPIFSIKADRGIVVSFFEGLGFAVVVGDGEDTFGLVKEDRPVLVWWTCTTFVTSPPLLKSLIDAYSLVVACLYLTPTVLFISP